MAVTRRCPRCGHTPVSPWSSCSQTAQWRISSGWAWLAWSWWCSGCCYFRLETTPEGPSMQPGCEHRGNNAPFRVGEPWSPSDDPRRG
nr:leukocyte immunoglobulin like receptor A2 [Myotis myotis]